jgi:hypothetical protein
MCAACEDMINCKSVSSSSCPNNKFLIGKVLSQKLHCYRQKLTRVYCDEIVVWMYAVCDKVNIRTKQDTK